MRNSQLEKVTCRSKLLGFPCCENNLGMKLLIMFSKVWRSELMFNFLPKTGREWGGAFRGP